MADNVQITAGSGTSIATDDIGSVQYQRVKTAIGPDGTFKGDLRTYGSSTALSFNAGLQSLATSATAGQVSASVDLSAECADDVRIAITAKMTTSGTPTGLVEVYAITSVDNSTWSGDVSGYAGSNGSYTLGAAASPNLNLLGYIKPHANTSAYTQEFSLRAACGGSLPPYFAVVIVNNSAIALHSSGSGGNYRVRY